METEVERDVARWQRHTRHAMHIWASVTTLSSLSPVPLPRNQLSFPQKLGLPAPQGRRKRSLLSLQIHESPFQKHTPSAMRWKTLLKSWTQVAAQELLSRNWSKPHLLQNPQIASHQGSLFRAGRCTRWHLSLRTVKEAGEQTKASGGNQQPQ